MRLIEIEDGATSQQGGSQALGLSSLTTALFAFIQKKQR